MASHGYTLLGEQRTMCFSRPHLPHSHILLIVTSDVGYETYKAHRRGPTALEAAHLSEPTRLGMIAVKRSVFQSIASMYVSPEDRRLFDSHVL